MAWSASLSLCACPVKLSPPGAPEVNVTVNDTLIWWSKGHPRPENIEFVDFQVQIKPKAEPWEVSFPAYILTIARLL